MWPLLNTMQILTILPLFATKMPANVLQIRDIVLSIVNCQLIPKETLYRTIIKPIMGENENLDTKKDSLFKNVLMIILVVVIIGLLIALIVFCKRSIIPKCYNPVKNIVALIEAKLMFNSILRSCLQTFLATFLALLFSLKVIDPSTT